MLNNCPQLLSCPRSIEIIERAPTANLQVQSKLTEVYQTKLILECKMLDT